MSKVINLQKLFLFFFIFSFSTIVVIISYYCHPTHADDSFIYYRYVKNFFDFGFFSFNENEMPVQGTSGLFYAVLLLLGGYFLNFQIPQVAAIWGAMFVFLCVGLLSFQIQKHKGYQLFLVFFLALTALFFDQSFLYWASSGMETIGFAALIIFPAIFKIRKKHQLFTYYILISTFRPEGFLIAFALVVAIVVEAVLIHWRTRSLKAHLKAIIPHLLIFLTALFSVLYIQYLLFGAFVPNTVTAKSGDVSQSIFVGWDYFVNFIKQPSAIVFFISYLVIFLAFIRRWFSLRLEAFKSRDLYILFVLYGYVLFIICAGGDGLHQFRFFNHLYPLAILAMVFGYAELTKLKEVLSKKLYLVLNSCIFLILFVINIWVLILSYERINFIKWTFGDQSLIASSISSLGQGLFPSAHSPVTSHRLFPREDRTELALELNKITSPGEIISVTPAGKLSYYLPGRVIVDALGLNDRFIALNNKNNNTSKYKGGHGVYNDDYIIFRKPDYIVIGSVYREDYIKNINKDWDISEIFAHLVSVPADEALFYNDKFLNEYGLIWAGPIKLNTSESFYFPLAKRHASPSFANIATKGRELKLRFDYQFRKSQITENQLLLSTEQGYFGFGKFFLSLKTNNTICSQGLVLDVIYHRDGGELKKTTFFSSCIGGNNSTFNIDIENIGRAEINIYSRSKGAMDGKITVERFFRRNK